ncbi:MAG TPA: MoxR family ATPase [Thermoanaerobaculia bacterium]|nr:MoxR family ATPase [Thermoanaerobaculia bacterium]
MTVPDTTTTPDLAEADVARLLEQLAALEREIGKAIIGQQEVVRQALVALLANGHCLLEGVPGLGKTLLVRSLAAALHLSFKRIQFTPDLMPSDILGTAVLEEEAGTGRRHFRFDRGPVFANLVLADEINRSPPKTQAALLEAMQEREVTYGGDTHSLERPFLVLATQNPIEQAGTYPLPEAQLDRFLLQLRVDYPSEAEERAIVAATTGGAGAAPQAVMDAGEVVAAQALVRQVHLSEPLLDYATRLVRASRPGGSPVAEVERFVEWGAGPRAGQALVLAAKASALLDGRLAVTLDELRRLARPVLRHRVLINFQGQAERIGAEAVVAQLIAQVPPPQSPLE